MQNSNEKSASELDFDAYVKPLLLSQGFKEKFIGSMIQRVLRRHLQYRTFTLRMASRNYEDPIVLDVEHEVRSIWRGETKINHKLFIQAFVDAQGEVQSYGAALVSTLAHLMLDNMVDGINCYDKLNQHHTTMVTFRCINVDHVYKFCIENKLPCVKWQKGMAAPDIVI